MFLDHVRDLASRVTQHTDQTAEHEAAVELLVLTAYADHRVTHEELDQLQAFDSSHASWDEGAFSVQQYLPIAVAKVRRTLDLPGGPDQLLGEAAGRITSADVRAETLRACRSMAAADGEAAEAAGLLGKLQAALA